MEKRCILAGLCVLQLTVLAVANDHRPKTIKRIDTHCHYIPPFYAQLLKENNITAGGWPTPAWNVSLHLALMETLNISLSVCSISTPGAGIMDGYPVDQSRKLARKLNEYGYNMSMQYPKKFKFFATLTLPDVEGAVAEAVYALDNLGAAGVTILASSSGQVLGSPLFAPLYAALNERNATVFVHPSQSPCPGTTEIFDPNNSTGLPPYSIDFLLDTTRAAVNLVYRNVTGNYPNVKFVLAHSGGFLPFATSRIIGSLRLLTNGTEEYVVSQLKKFYVDTATSGSKYALPSTLALLDTTQITFGSDFPFVPTVGYVPEAVALDQLLQQKLAPKVRGQVNYKNAARLFGLTNYDLRSFGFS